MTNEKIIKIHWPGSKHTLAGFIDADLNVRASQNPELATKVRAGSGFLEGLIYDLGHPGRGFRDFPMDFDLTVFDYKNRRGFVLARSQLAELYRKISDVINPYIEKRNRGQRRKNYQNELTALQALSESAGEQQVKLDLDKISKWHRIKGIDTDGYGYERPY